MKIIIFLFRDLIERQRVNVSTVTRNSTSSQGQIPPPASTVGLTVGPEQGVPVCFLIVPIP